MKIMTLAFCIGVLILVGCSQETPTTENSETPADYVFTNASVYTVNEDQPEAEAIAVFGNEIVFVGSVTDVEAYIGEGTEVIDAIGKTIMPGFVSAHDHLVASNWTLLGVQIYDAKDKADALDKIKAYAEANPDEKVIRGIGWDKNMLGGLPTAAELDEAVSDRPTIILDNTIHDGWLNTAALKAANITKEYERYRTGRDLLGARRGWQSHGCSD